MISETEGLVLDVVVAAPSERAADLECAVRRLRADLDRRFPGRRTRITIACEPESAAAAERLSASLDCVRIVRLEQSKRRPGLRTARLGSGTVSASDASRCGPAGGASANAPALGGTRAGTRLAAPPVLVPSRRP